MFIIGMAILPIINTYYEGSLLAYRFQIGNIEDESRYDLLITAFKTGFQNPIFGVGPRNFILYSGSMSFSHCSYSELIANSGIIALILYISILYYLFKKNIQLFRKGLNYRKFSIYIFMFLCFYVIYNLFYVFYEVIFLMGFLFLVIVHLDKVISTEGRLDIPYENILTA